MLRVTNTTDLKKLEEDHSTIDQSFFITATTGPMKSNITYLRRHHSTTQTKGFTLLELLVVMVIIGLLAGYVGPKYFAQIGKSEIKVARAQIDSLEKALDQYRIDTGHYPSTELGLAALMGRPPNEPKWDGPYLKKNVPFDPWGRAY